MVHNHDFGPSLRIPVPYGRVAAWDAGSGLPVVFVHGGTATAAHDWGELVMRLRERARCITFDLRGHGDSAVGVHDIGVSRFGLDVAHVMERLGIGSALIVGFSVGANSALHLAAHRPGLAKAVVTIGASAQANAARVEELMSSPWPRELIELGHATGDPEHWRKLRSLLITDWAANVDFLAIGLGAVTCPVWLLHGVDDKVVHHSQADLLAGALPDARVVKIPAAGHQAHREQPQQVADVIRQALKEARR